MSRIPIAPFAETINNMYALCLGDISLTTRVHLKHNIHSNSQRTHTYTWIIMFFHITITSKVWLIKGSLG